MKLKPETKLFLKVFALSFAVFFAVAFGISAGLGAVGAGNSIALSIATVLGGLGGFWMALCTHLTR